MGREYIIGPRSGTHIKVCVGVYGGHQEVFATLETPYESGIMVSLAHGIAKKHWTRLTPAEKKGQPNRTLVRRALILMTCDYNKRAAKELRKMRQCVKLIGRAADRFEAEP